jgi:hypothetical protein
MVIEADLGLGLMVSDYTVNGGAFGFHTQQTSSVAPAIALGVGRRLSPQLEFGGRIAIGMVRVDTIPPYISPTTFLSVGPAVRYWLNTDIWLGAGLGPVVLSNTIHTTGAIGGLGADLRIGYSFGSARRLSVALELLPAIFTDAPREVGLSGGPPGQSSFASGVTVMVGYATM